MHNLELFLEQNIYQEGLKFYGLGNKEYAKQLALRWHNDLNSSDTLRWKEVESFGDHKGKILDMACGCGTFLFSGLRKGYDVYGIEPEEYKLKYMGMKIDEINYPQEWKARIIKGVGENLPFKNDTFDYIESAQTLEHVQDFRKCLDEMLRVLKVGGKIRISAPDYGGFYEAHYRLPFLPKMNRKLASFYLKILNRPTGGLDMINYITSIDIMEYLKKYKNLNTIDLAKSYKDRRAEKINKNFKVGKYLSRMIANIIYYRQEYLFVKPKVINIVIIKEERNAI
ncbi:MAG: class I SAM-dependent methyltransferase [Campylobacterales bacterium]|nr:class I SAM-dependent methyltransferase [Campylobacterales bacterium]